MGFFSASSSASQSTQTASGEGQIVSGVGNLVSNPGSITVGTAGRYVESGGLEFTGNNANLGTSLAASGIGSSVTVQNLDQGVVTDALNTVASLQQESNKQLSVSQAALKSANDNLAALLGQTTATAATATTLSPTLIKWLKWAGGGLLAMAVLYFLFRKR